jgi:hypothetical protein
MMNRNEVFMGTRNMENMVKMKIMRGSGNNRSTNAINRHTYTVHCVNMIRAMVAIMGSQLSNSPMIWSVALESRYQLGYVPWFIEIAAYSSSKRYQKMFVV